MRPLAIPRAARHRPLPRYMDLRYRPISDVGQQNFFAGLLTFNVHMSGQT